MSQNFDPSRMKHLSFLLHRGVFWGIHREEEGGRDKERSGEGSGEQGRELEREKGEVD